MAADTGHGATVTLSSSALVLDWKSIDMGNETRPSVEDWHLASTKKTKMPGDIPDEGKVTIPFNWDDYKDAPVTSSTPETATFTYASGATWAGTGMIVDVKRPNSETGTLKQGQIVFEWDAKTGPTFTKAV